jgi:hypothetical protein
MEPSGSSTAAKLLERVPAESRALVEQLLDEPLLSSVVLRGEVEAHLDLFRDAQRTNTHLDIRQAEALASRCHQLLDLVDNDAPEERRQLVQVAVRYFIIEDDGDDDVQTGGLDDDEAVVSAVVDALSTSDS